MSYTAHFRLIITYLFASIGLAAVHAQESPPSVLLEGPTKANGTFGMTAVFSENVSFFNGSEFIVTNGRATNVNKSGPRYNFIVIPDGDGTTTVTFPAGVVNDSDGNGNAASNTISVQVDSATPDATGPTVSLIGPATTDQGYVDVLATFPERVTRPIASLWQVSNGTITVSGDSVAYRLQIIPDGIGTTTVFLPANKVTDDASNGNEASNILSIEFGTTEIDNTPPEVALTFGEPTNGFFSASARFSEPVFGLTPDDFKITDGVLVDFRGLNPDFALVVQYGTASETLIEIPADSFTDAAGNGNLAIPILRVPTGPPIIDSPTVILQGPASAPGMFGVTAVFNEEVIGLSIGDFAITNGNAINLIGGGLSYSFTVLPNAGDVTTITLKAGTVSDDEGNRNFASDPLSVAIDSVSTDTTPPTITLTGLTLTNRGSATAIATFSENVTRPSNDSWQITNGSVQVVGQSPVYTIEITPDVLGTSTVFLPANQVTDDAGNGNAESNVLTIDFRTSDNDTIAPDGTLSARRLRDQFSQVSMIFDEIVFGFSLDDFEITNGTIISDQVGVNPSFAFVIEQGAEGETTVTLPADSVTDAAGNGNATFSIRLQGDLSAIDQLGSVSLPSVVQSPSTVNLSIPYEVSSRRELQIRLHDENKNWATIGQADIIVEPGSSNLEVPISILPGAREGAGYVWALRLLPIDWVSIDEAFSEVYASASVESDPGDPILSDKLIGIILPGTFRPTDTVTLRVNYEASERRDLEVLLQDSTDNWRTIARGRVSVNPGAGTEVFTIGISGDARVGEGYVWAVRLLPEGSTNADDALDAIYNDESVAEPDNGTLVNYAVLPLATATQSSVYGAYFDARLARDGNTDGDWRNRSVTHTELEPNAWWEINLGGVKQIDHVLIWNRTDCCQDRLSPFYVMVSDVPFVSGDLDVSLNQTGVTSSRITAVPKSTQRIDINRSGRYVRIQLAGADYLSLAEVEVFGENEGPVRGVTYEYFEGTWPQLPDLDALTPMKTGTLEAIGLNPRLRGEFYAFRYRGCLRAPQDGTYRFYTSSNDIAKLFLDGQLVTENVDSGGSQGDIYLTEGMHPFEFQYWQGDGVQRFDLTWEGPGLPRNTIPATINETGVSPGFRHALRQLAADDNTDGDLFDLTAEYALGLDPTEGGLSHLGVHVEANGGHIDVWYDRPARMNEIDYLLEHSDDAKNWGSLDIDPIITTEFYGRERVRYTDLTNHEAVNSARGYVRLRIKHQPWNHESTTPIQGWYQTDLHAGHQTHGLSLNREAVFGSTIAAISVDELIVQSGGLMEALEEGRAYYVEFVSGFNVGHRIDVDVERTGDQSIRLDWTASHNTLTSLHEEDLAGAQILIRPHWTLAEAYSKALFQGSADVATADQLLFFNGQGYDGYFLLEAQQLNYWTPLGDASLQNADDTVIPPGMGCFIKRADGANPDLPLIVMGHLRKNEFVQKLRLGHNLIVAPRPGNLSPQSRGLMIENGFLGGVDPANADQIQIWLGDSAATDQQGYASYFLLDGGNADLRYWTPSDDANLTNVNESPIFAGDRAAFVEIVSEPHRRYRIPAMGDE